MMIEQQPKKMDAARNKRRYLSKLARKEKEELEKAKRREEKISKDNDLKEKKDMIAAAVNRVRKKRQER